MVENIISDALKKPQKSVLHSHLFQFLFRQIIKIFSGLNVNGQAVQRKSLLSDRGMRLCGEQKFLTLHRRFHRIEYLIVVINVS